MHHFHAQAFRNVRLHIPTELNTVAAPTTNVVSRSMIPLPVPTPRHRKLPPPPDRRTIIHQLPSPSKRHRSAAQCSIESQVRSASTPYEQNVILVRAMNTLLERMHDMEYKLQHKTAQVYEAQSDDLLHRSGQVLSEQIHGAKEYTTDL